MAEHLACEHAKNRAVVENGLIDWCCVALMATAGNMSRNRNSAHLMKRKSRYRLTK